MHLIKLIRDQLSATFCRRPFYSKTREVFGEHRSARHDRLYALDCALFLYSHRLLWIAYLMYVDFAPIQGDDLDAMMRNDVMLGFAYTNRHIYPPIFVFMLYIFQAFVWITETLIRRFDPTTITWRWWYESAVLSQDAYRAAALPSEVITQRRRKLEIRYSGPSTRGCMLVPRVAKRVYCSIAARLRLWWTLSNIDRRQFFAERQQSVFLNLSKRLRRKTILFLIAADYVEIIFQQIVAILFDMFQKENTIAYTLFGRGRIIVEIYLLYYCSRRLAHLATFFICCSIFGTMIYTGHVINVTRPVIDLVWQFRQRRPLNREASHFGLEGKKSGKHQPKQSMLSYRKYGALISRQLVDHNKVSYMVLRCSLELFGSVMFSFLLLNLPLNIYLIRQIWFSRSKSVEQIAVSIIFVWQIFAAIVGIIPLAWCCHIYHLPKRFIPRFQAITSEAKWLRLKLKFDDLYGRLIRGPKIGLTIGPMDVITYKAVFEFVLLYVAYLLKAFSQQIENNLKRSRETIV